MTHNTAATQIPHTITDQNCISMHISLTPYMTGTGSLLILITITFTISYHVHCSQQLDLSHLYLIWTSAILITEVCERYM